MCDGGVALALVRDGVDVPAGRDQHQQQDAQVRGQQQRLDALQHRERGGHVHADEDNPADANVVRGILHDMEAKIVRGQILNGEARIDGWLAKVRARVRFGVQCPSQQRDLCGLLDEMRLVKDTHELDLMRRAARISAMAPSCIRSASVSLFAPLMPSLTCRDALLSAKGSAPATRR